MNLKPCGLLVPFFLLLGSHALGKEDAGAEAGRYGLPIVFDAPGDGFVSIVVKNGEGQTVCSLAKAMPVKKGRQTLKWHVGTTEHWWTEKQRGKFQAWRKNFGHDVSVVQRAILLANSSP